MESDICTLMMQRISERKRQIEQSLASGNARSFEEYQKLVGMFAAFVDMEEELKDLEQRYLAA